MFFGKGRLPGFLDLSIQQLDLLSLSGSICHDGA